MTLSKLVANVKDKSGYALSLLRIFLGIVFILHGWGKVTAIDGVIGMVTSFGFPAPVLFAWLAALAEFAGGILLVLGLFTRYAAFAIAVNMIVAIIKVHLSKGFFLANGGYEFVLTLLVIAVALIINGAGMWSLEKKLLGKELG